MSASNDRQSVDDVDDRECTAIERARQLSDELQVSVTAAVNAAVCGAAGCRETDDLLKIVTDSRQRVLCEQHALDWLSEVVA